MAFGNLLAGEIWNSKYRFTPADGPGPAHVEGTGAPVRAALSSMLRKPAKGRSFEAVRGHHLPPDGRILAEVGTGRAANLFDCFVEEAATVKAPRVAPVACPHCGDAGLIRREGCDSCLDCRYSKCGRAR